jgi:NAD(P)-dependent dehydrogenase (short-subunit alcohol dehydrogenase family)
VTKHAVVGLAQWLAVTYGDEGIRVSCLCPEMVRTDMTAWISEDQMPADAIDPEAVADAVVEGLREERFLILPHPQVAEYFRRRADDPDRWLRGMRRLLAKG